MVSYTDACMIPTIQVLDTTCHSSISLI